MFTYDPLSESSSMRLLQLQPNRINGQIQANLIHPSSPYVKYTCLSYMWGPLSEQRNILINGHPFPVRQNLFTFLNMGTGYFLDELLWIDAICINQADLAEKSHQVQRMGDIYRNAEQVLVWLGFDDCFDDLFSVWETNPRNVMLGCDTDNLLNCINHPYFSRTWITQELLLGRKIIMLHKNMQLRWALFVRRIMWAVWELKRRDIPIEIVIVEQLYRMRKTANWREGPSALFWLIHGLIFRGYLLTSELMQTSAGSALGKGYYDFFEVLNLRLETHCTDTRDRLFSLNSLLEPGHGFKVDYQESTADVFWRICEHFNTWVDMVRTWHVSKALSLSALELLVSMENRLMEKITLRFQEGRFHEPAALHVGSRSDAKSKQLYCKRNVHRDAEKAARVERRFRNDLLLCPIQHGNSLPPECMRPHFVVSQKSEDDPSSMTITLFHGPHTQSEISRPLYYFEGTHVKVDDWSQVQQIRKKRRSQASPDAYWALKLPLFWAIDIIAQANGETNSDIADTLKADHENLLVSNELKTAFLQYTQHDS